jgi:hypothetical protein
MTLPSCRVEKGLRRRKADVLNHRSNGIYVRLQSWANRGASKEAAAKAAMAMIEAILTLIMFLVRGRLDKTTYGIV